jgi:hypothetical protein
LATAEELWLGVFQRLCDATAHQFKGALNGVAVNLEVVRSRSGRGDADVSALRPFAEAAAAELESVIQSAEAMLALARSARGPADVARITRDVAVLVSRGEPGGAAETQDGDGRRLTVEKGVERLGTTSAPTSAARLAIAAVLLAALEASKDVVCSAVDEAGGPAIRVSLGERDGSRIALSDEVVSAAYSAGVHLDISESGATITFPT